MINKMSRSLTVTKGSKVVFLYGDKIPFTEEDPLKSVVEGYEMRPWEDDDAIGSLFGLDSLPSRITITKPT